MSAMQNAAKLLSKSFTSKPEQILRKIPRNSDNSVFISKYQEYLNNLTRMDSSNVNFSRKYFKSFPKSLMKSLIDDSVRILKDRKLLNYSGIYNTIIRNYIANDISFEIKDILQDMNDNNVPFNKGTYELLVDIYCERGDMSAVENLLEIIKSNKIDITKKYLYTIVTGYIIAGQSEKVDDFLIQNNLNENDLTRLVSEACGYASLSKTASLMDTINKIIAKHHKVPMTASFNIYSRMVKAGAPMIDLEQVLTSIIDVANPNCISDLILYLNDARFYNHSGKLVEKFKDNLLTQSIVEELITSFNLSECPLVVYKRVLELLLDRVEVYSHKHLFRIMNYDDAHKFAMKNITPKNGVLIMTSLMNNAISAKCVKSISHTVDLGMSHLPIYKMNFLFHFGFIPAIFQSGLATNSKELFHLLPKHKYLLLAPMLLFNLSRGNLTEFHSILAEEKFKSPLMLSIISKPIALEIMRNLSFKEINNLVDAAKKVFIFGTVKDLTRQIVIEKILVSSKTNNSEGIMDAIKLAEDFDLRLRSNEVEIFKKLDSNHIELIKPWLEKSTLKSPDPTEDTLDDLEVGNIKMEAILEEQKEK